MMQQAWRIDPNVLRPFNDAPEYLRGEVKVDEFDNLLICGHSQDQMQAWHNIGAQSPWLEPESFELLASTLSLSDLGACSTRIVDDDERTRIALSHFVRSSVDLRAKHFVLNFYSGFGFDDAGNRSQLGIPAEWEARGRHHNVILRYDHNEGLFSCYANDILVHWVRSRARRFKLQVLVQAVGVDGDFDFRFERLMYRPRSQTESRNLATLRGWLPEYSPTFISYSHADKPRVEPLVTSLRSKGVRVTGDWDFRPGDSLIERISTHISRASFLVVLLTPTAVKSRWVSKELEIALSRQLAGEASLRIIPVMLAHCEVPPFLKGMLQSDLTEPSNAVQLERLLERLSFRTQW